jgi:hypothetical protein
VTRSRFPWPDREVGSRRFAWASMSAFATAAFLIAAVINNAMLNSTENSLKNVLVDFVFTGVAFGIEIWFAVIKRNRAAFFFLRYFACTGLILSILFDVYFLWSAIQLGTSFDIFGNDSTVNTPAVTAFAAVSSNITGFLSLYFGLRNNWFYAVPDNDCWE